MADENEMTTTPISEPAREKVGDIIRKERITRRIALETIAKDLKLNVKYIRALESNEYHDLPPDPYIRVYLRSLAKYLLLDPEEILKKFYEERGIHDEKYRKGSDSQIAITMSDQEKKKETRPWLIIFIVILVLAGFSIIAKKMGGVPSSSGAGGHAQTAHQADSVAEKQQKDRTVNDSSVDSLLGSLIPHDQPQKTDTVAKPVIKDTTTMTFEIRVKPGRDSVWIQAFSDGVSWKNWLKPGQLKRFTARDSFNFHVGNNRLLEYSCNGNPMKLNTTDVAIFKICKHTLQPELWNLAKWNLIFKNRL
jgi:transcriptional regulator with XRE-family HTH domain